MKDKVLIQLGKETKTQTPAFIATETKLPLADVIKTLAELEKEGKAKKLASADGKKTYWKTIPITQ